MRKKELDKEQLLAKELFAKMSRKEKAKYILHYHGLHIFVVIAILLGVVGYIRDYQDSKIRENWLYFVLPSDYCYDIEAAADQLAQAHGWPEGINYPVYTTDDLESGYGNMQLVAYLTNDEVDYMVCDEAMLIMLREDETLDFDAVELEQTALGETLEFRRKLFVLTFYDTARYDKVIEFHPILMGTQEDGQSA